ncbi:retrovirus-related pol polyprotein LINE-1 [Tanacetum coccineum]
MRGEDEANRSAVEERYKEAKREAKKAVARAKEKAYEDRSALFVRFRYRRNPTKQLLLLEDQTQKFKRRYGRWVETRRREPIEAWRCLGGEGVRWLTILFNKTFLRAKMPEEWRLNERVIERRLRRETEVSENQFGFMPGRSTMEAIHIIRSLMEKYRERQKDLHLAFLNLEKAHDSVQRELIWKTLNDKGTPNEIHKIYPVNLTNGIQESIPWCLIFADDIVLVSKMPHGNESDPNEEEEIRIGEHILELKESFRYLGSVMHKSGRIEDDVTHRILVGWLKCRAATRILCDKKVPLKLKGKFYRVTIRPAIMYGSECWPLTKVQANRMEVAEMRMLRWEDRLKTDLKEMLLSKDMTSDRNAWRTRIRVDEGAYASLTNPRGLNPPPHIFKPGKALPFQEVGVATSELFAPNMIRTWDLTPFSVILASPFTTRTPWVVASRSFLPIGFLVFHALRLFVLLSAFLAFCAASCSLFCSSVALLYRLCFLACLLLCRYVLFVYAFLFGLLICLFVVDTCARFRCSLVWYVVMRCLLPEVFLEAVTPVPLPSGRGVTVYIPPPP